MLRLLVVAFLLCLAFVSSCLLFVASGLVLVSCRSFNVKVNDGTWQDVFGNLSEISSQPFCTGGVNGWPMPNPYGQALTNLLGNSSGIFKCGYVAFLFFVLFVFFFFL